MYVIGYLVLQAAKYPQWFMDLVIHMASFLAGVLVGLVVWSAVWMLWGVYKRRNQ